MNKLDTNVVCSLPGNCIAGQFCPAGSSAPTACTPGHFCAIDFLNDTSGECDPGYYCTAYAYKANLTDGNVTGENCRPEFELMFLKQMYRIVWVVALFFKFNILHPSALCS